jgi:parallel beta-helix repeat protein
MSGARTIWFPSEGVGSITKAMVRAQKGDTVRVVPGEYVLDEFFVSEGTVLLADSVWTAVLKGKGRGNLVVLPRNAEISGFVIKDAGVGVVSRGEGNRIARCRIMHNRHSGIMCIGHLPQIEDNEIVYNKGSGIQGWNLRGTVYKRIRNNTIAYNKNNGIALDGARNIVLAANILAHNGNFGIKVAKDTTNVALEDNIFYFNGHTIERLPSENFSCDPCFAAPKKMDFRADMSCECKNVVLSRKIGTRVYYEDSEE